MLLVQIQMEVLLELAFRAERAPGTYTYNYTGGAPTLDLFNAPPGSYVLTVSDTNGCVIESLPFTINSTISNITLASTSSSATCHGNCDGSIDLLASGGDGNYSYTCSNGMAGGSLINVLCWYPYYLGYRWFRLSSS